MREPADRAADRRARAPTWSPRFVDGIIADRVFLEVQDFAWAVKTDPEHPLRKAIDVFLVEFAGGLQRDRETIERVERMKDQIVEHPEVRGSSARRGARSRGSCSTPPRTLVSAAAAGADGLLALGARLNTDAELRGKIDGWLVGAAGYMVGTTAGEITKLITDTVARWDAGETSRKVELQVGRDLQFIRINGTVVGALAGLAIYTVSQVVFGFEAPPARHRQAGRLQELAQRRSVGRMGTAEGAEAPGEQAGGPVGGAVGQAVGDIGAYIRAQREHAKVSLRQLARTAG